MMCRIVTKVLETGAVVPGEYVLTHEEATELLALLPAIVGSYAVERWIECIPAVIS